MRRTRKSSFGGEATVTTVSGGLDQKRRTELLAEARRKRVAWVEEARGVDQGLNGARRRKETEVVENGKKAESELERLFPSAVAFHDFLSKLAGDPDESPGGDLSAILQPFMVQDVDIGDDRPIPSYNREGVTPYDVFLDKLRHPRAAEVVKSLQQFVASFKARAERAQPTSPAPLGSPSSRGAHGSSTSRVGVPITGNVKGGVNITMSANSLDGEIGITATTMSGMMHAFLGRVETQMRESTLWKRETQAQWDQTRESMERIVMHKVFDQAYRLCCDIARDEAISERLRSLGFLTEEHLGVAPLVDKEGSDVTWSDAEAELVKMADMRCPGDMLRCIIRCTRIVGSLLTGNCESGVLPGADEFLPALILLVKRANPPNIHSNLEFIQSFRDPSKLLSEAGYVLTQLVSAMCFLEDVDASVLTIAHGEFERGLKGFQETARVGLQAHQQKVKKEEEQERILHINSEHERIGGASVSSTAAASVAAADGTTESGSPASCLLGPAPLPKPEKAQEIAPGEVRSRRHFAYRTAGVGHDQQYHQLLFPTPVGDVTSSGTGGGGDGDEAAGASGHGVDRGLNPYWPNRDHTTVKTTEKYLPMEGGAGDMGTRGLRPRYRKGHFANGAAGGVAAQLRFVGCTAEELKVSELPALLAEHNQLARLCEELLAERAELGHRRRHL